MLYDLIAILFQKKNMSDEKKVPLADMHGNGIRFNQFLKAKKMRKDAKRKMLNKKLKVKK
jgi:hypothetical protein